MLPKELVQIQRSFVCVYVCGVGGGGIALAIGSRVINC